MINSYAASVRQRSLVSIVSMENYWPWSSLASLRRRIWLTTLELFTKVARLDNALLREAMKVVAWLRRAGGSAIAGFISC